MSRESDRRNEADRDAWSVRRRREQPLIRALHQSGAAPSWSLFDSLAAQEGIRAKHLVEFVAAFLSGTRAVSVLDPIVCAPALLGSIETARRRVGYVEQPELADAAAVISGSTVQWMAGKPTDLVRRSDERFEWLVCSPPLGPRVDGSIGADLPESIRSVLPRSDLGLSPVLLAANRIDHGLVVLVGEGSLQEGSHRSAWADYLGSLGWTLASIISVAGGLGPASTGFPTALCLFERTERADVFVARLTATTDIPTLVEAVVQRRPGRREELGCLIPPGTFNGWASFHAQSAFRRAMNASPLSLVPLSQIAENISTVEVAPNDKMVARPSNAIYFHTYPAGHQPVQTQPFGPKDGATRSVRSHEVVLDPEQASAGFLSAWLNGEVGRLSIKSRVRGSNVPSIRLSDIRDIEVPLPSIQQQHESVRLLTQMVDIEAQIETLRSRVVAQPWNFNGANNEFDRLLQGNTEADWIERLPFPLASIGRRYHADSDPGQKAERLLYFFEAWAEFTTTILLSVVSRHPTLWADNLPSLRGIAPHPFDKTANFGGWTTLGQTLAKALRPELQQRRDTDDLRALFGVSDRSFVEALLDKKVWKSLERARDLRNQRAHTPFTEDKQKERILAAANEVLNELHSFTPHCFEGVHLIQPGAGYKDGGERIYAHARRLIGSNSAFLERTLIANARVDLDAKDLAFVDSSSLVEDALVLLPLVRLRPSPPSDENTIVFYNAREREHFRYVSYHSAHDDHSETLDDPRLSDFLTDFFGSGNQP